MYLNDYNWKKKYEKLYEHTLISNKKDKNKITKTLTKMKMKTENIKMHQIHLKYQETL